MSTLGRAVNSYREQGPIQFTKESSRYLFEKGGRRLFSGPIQSANAVLGARLYSNCSGLTKNVGGDIAEAKCRLQTDHEALPSTFEENAAGDARKLRRDGYVKLGKRYDDETIESIRDAYTAILDSDEATNTRGERTRDGDVYSRKVLNIGRNLPEAERLVSTEVAEIFTAYYRSYFIVRNVMAYRTSHIPSHLVEEKDFYNNYWHLDGAPTDHIKLFICLSDTTEEDGPLHIMPNSGMERIASKCPNFDRNRDGQPGGMVDELGEPVTLTGEMGTAMLANTQTCLHRAGVPDEGHERDLIQFYCAPATEELEPGWIRTSDLPGATHNTLLRLFDY